MSTSETIIGLIICVSLFAYALYKAITYKEDKDE